MKKAKLQTLDIYAYKPIRYRRNALLTACAIGFVFAIAVMIADANWHQHIVQILSNSFATDAQMKTLKEARMSMFLLHDAYGAYFVLSLIVFAFWLYRSVYNSYPLAIKDIDFTPLTAVIWLCVPVIHWFKPCKCLGQLYNGTRMPYLWKQQKMPVLAGGLIVLNILLVIFTAMGLYLLAKSNPTFGDKALRGTIYLIRDITFIAWYVTLGILVFQISGMQMKRAKELTMRANQEIL